MIETVQLTKNFGTLRAVDHLNLTISQGEFFAFLGPNAAGKTTTIKMLTGLLRPTSGSCRVCGHDLQKEPEAAKVLMSYIPDFPFLYDKLTAQEFMQFIGELFCVDRALLPKKIDALFDRLGLEPFQNELTENLSHGTKQRVAIAAALLHDPRVIIIDEPMVGLDPMHARIVKDELKERSRKGATVFLSTHTLNVAEEMADRVGIINEGQLIALGTVDELREQSHEDGALENVFLTLVGAKARAGVGG